MDVPHPPRRPHHERLHLLGAGHRLDARRSVFGGVLGHRLLDGPAPRRGERGGARLLAEIGSIENVAPTIEPPLPARRRSWGSGIASITSRIRAPSSCSASRRSSSPASDGSRSTTSRSRSSGWRRTAWGRRGIFPNIDFYSGAVYAKMGIPQDLFTPVFAAGRVSGWLAHWLEMLNTNRIYRPDQIYSGKHGQRWVPITQRS